MAPFAAAMVSARLAPKLEEAELIRAVQQGDQSAFEALVRCYDQSVLGLAMNLLRSPEDARDAYQEAFLRVYKNIHSFRFDCNFYTWLYRIVTNVCVDHLRKRKIRKEEPATIETGEGQIDRTYTVEEDRAAGDPERNLWNRQLSFLADRKRFGAVDAASSADGSSVQMPAPRGALHRAVRSIFAGFDIFRIFARCRQPAAKCRNTIPSYRLQEPLSWLGVNHLRKRRSGKEEPATIETGEVLRSSRTYTVEEDRAAGDQAQSC